MGRFFKHFLLALILGYMVGYAVICAIIVNNAFGAPVSYASKNWGLQSIQAQKAWRLNEGSSKVVVAVIDTGLDRDHEEFNYAVLPGWDFVLSHPIYGDEIGHGTHVAGIIRAVAPDVALMPIRYFSYLDRGKTQVKRTVAAFEYAVSKGVQVINYSGGGPEFDPDEYLAIKKAQAKGILVVVAAGNEGNNTDLVENDYYPAGYHTSNMIVVGSMDEQNQLLHDSNYGDVSVDVAAPGQNIYSTLNSGRYGYSSGTSMAAPFVTGTAALLLSDCHGLKPEIVKEIIVRTAIPAKTLRVASGRINAYAALLELRRRKDYGEVICGRS